MSSRAATLSLSKPLSVLPFCLTAVMPVRISAARLGISTSPVPLLSAGAVAGLVVGGGGVAFVCAAGVGAVFFAAAAGFLVSCAFFSYGNSLISVTMNTLGSFVCLSRVFLIVTVLKNAYRPTRSGK